MHGLRDVAEDHLVDDAAVEVRPGEHLAGGVGAEVVGADRGQHAPGLAQRCSYAVQDGDSGSHLSLLEYSIPAGRRFVKTITNPYRSAGYAGSSSCR